ncbi:MAG: hypothetical protein QM581_14000 [Pseudomonas sp.]
MRKIASFITQGITGPAPAWRAPARSLPQQPSLARALSDIRRRHIAAHAALLDLIIPSRLRA